MRRERSLGHGLTSVVGKRGVVVCPTRRKKCVSFLDVVHGSAEIRQRLLQHVLIPRLRMVRFDFLPLPLRRGSADEGLRPTEA